MKTKFVLSEREEKLTAAQAAIDAQLAAIREALFAKKPLPIDKLPALNAAYEAAFKAPNVYHCAHCKKEIDPAKGDHVIIEGAVIRNGSGISEHARVVYCEKCSPI